jgi:RNA polymerase sigma-70 factor (ECF subfamily)
VRGDSRLTALSNVQLPWISCALYRCYYSRLARYLARRLPPSHSADEIIDDTFMAVWQHAADFRYQSQVSTWIFGIAYRVALNSLRRHKRWFVAFAGKSTEPVVDAHRQLEERDWLAEGLRRLPDNQRSSLLLIYQWGHSIEQVAAMAKCAAGTVKARSFSRSR